MRTGYVVRAVVVIEGRDAGNSVVAEVVNPGESDESVILVFIVTELAGGEDFVVEVVGIGLVGDLVIVGAELRDDTDLVVGLGL